MHRVHRRHVRSDRGRVGVLGLQPGKVLGGRSDELRILLEYLLPEMRATQAGGRLPLPRNCTFFMDPADWRAGVAEGHLSLRGCVQIGGSVNATLPPPYNFRLVLDSATAYACALNADVGLAAAARAAAAVPLP